MRPLLADWLRALKLNCGWPAKSEVTSAVLRDLDGWWTTINEHIGKGRWSLVVIWASNCHVCASEMPRFGAYYSSAPDPKFSILGVALDGYARKKTIVETMARWNMGFPSLVADMPALQWSGRKLCTSSHYGTPIFALFGPSGQLRKLDVGPVWISELENFIREYGLR